MWGNLMHANSVLWLLALVFLVYTLGEGVFMWTWKPFFIALGVQVVLTITEIVFAAIAD
jgi:hypothetical protein